LDLFIIASDNATIVVNYRSVTMHCVGSLDSLSISTTTQRTHVAFRR